MSRSFFSALTVITAGSLVYFWNKYLKSTNQLIERARIKQMIIQLRKRFYSSLREIAFIINNIRMLQGDNEVTKIGDIVMRDGGSGQKKLTAIEDLLFQEYHTTKESFQHSCDHYSLIDLEIKILLEHLRREIQMALEGVIPSYNGPIHKYTSTKIITIEKEILKRRMYIIEQKYLHNISNQSCLKLESQIEEYLELEGIKNQNQSNQKVFMAMMEEKYRHDAQFKEEFQQLEINMELFIIQMENQKKNQIQSQQIKNQIQSQQINQKQQQIQQAIQVQESNTIQPIQNKNRNRNEEKQQEVKTQLKRNIF